MVIILLLQVFLLVLFLALPFQSNPVFFVIQEWSVEVGYPPHALGHSLAFLTKYCFQQQFV